MADVSITWLGHASFRLDTPGGKRIYIDPWLDNPKCPAGEKAVEQSRQSLSLGHRNQDRGPSTVEDASLTTEVILDL